MVESLRGGGVVVGGRGRVRNAIKNLLFTKGVPSFSNKKNTVIERHKRDFAIPADGSGGGTLGMPLPISHSTHTLELERLEAGAHTKLAFPYVTG